MENSGVKFVKLPTFDGATTKFQIWWIRCMAYAGVFGFARALAIGGEAGMPATEATVLDDTTELGKTQNGIKKRNAIAVANLTMAFTTDGTMALVFEAMTTEWPSGLAHVIVAALFTKYQPQDTMTRVELRQKLNKVSMKNTANPASIFEQLSSIKNQYNTTTKSIAEDDLIAVVIDAAPKQYQAVLTNEQLRLGTSLTMEHLRTAMNAHWRSIGSNLSNNDDDNEMALSAFVGTCYKCKKQGHKAHECPKKVNRGGNGSWNSENNGTKLFKFSGKCNNCGKVGHRWTDCWERDENKGKRPQGYRIKSTGTGSNERANASLDEGSKVEFLLCSMTFSTSAKILLDPNVRIADTAATVHTTAHAMGMTKTTKAKDGDAITVGDGTSVKAGRIGDIRGTICDKGGNEVEASTLTNVTYLPNGEFNLFSLTRLMKEGWLLGGNKKAIELTKGNNRVRFDIVIPTEKGMLFAMYFKRNTEIGGAMADLPLKMTIMEAHEKLGHSNEAGTRSAAKILGIDIVRGKMIPCEACTVAKSKQKNVPKQSEHVLAKKDERRIFLDISTIKSVKDGPRVTKPNWRIMVDERSTLKFSDFYGTKSGMVEPTCEQLHRWRQAGKAVKFIRLDNAGENKKLETRAGSKDWKLDIKFEYMAAATPQQNHLAELGFATLANRGRALMVRANIPEDVRYLLFKEAFKTSTLLDGLMAVEVENVIATRFVHFCGENPKFVKHLRTWGEAGTVKIKTGMTPKVSNRGVQCVFVGYATNHTGDTFRMWDPVTKGVHVTRDVIWLKRMYYQLKKKVLNIATTEQNETNEETNIEAGESTNIEKSGEMEDIAVSNVSENEEHDEDKESEDEDEIPESTKVTTRSGRTVVAPTRYIAEPAKYNAEVGAIQVETASYEIHLTNAEEHYYETMKSLHEGEFIAKEIMAVGAGIGGGFTNTKELHVMKYKEAMKGDDVRNWTKAVDEEHERMMKHHVWQAVLKKDIPTAAKIITTTWAMKKKASGVYRARLNARGYEQVDGEHYDSHNISSPVTNDITIRIVLVMMIMANWVGELLDVKGAFLHGEFEDGRNVYMEVPEGFEKYYDPMYYVLYLLQTIYGLKQSAKAFWNQLLMAFKSMSFERSKADPCLYFAWTTNGLVLWISWIDDCLVVGNPKGVKEAKKQLTERFDCDVVGNMDEYVGCKLERNEEEGWIKITQPVLLQSYTDEFELPSDAAPNTPAEAGQILMPCKQEDGLSDKLQSKFRSGVGKLLHMMRWSRPEILNSVRELSRHMKVASMAHLKAMYRNMKYCVTTPNRGILLKPTRKWDGNPNFEFIIKGRSDANYSSDPTNRRSISGYSVFLEGAPVSMKSGQQKSVTLSTAESELVSGTQCAQDMLYTMRIVESIGGKVKLPMILEIDNKGTVDLANNWSVGGRTRHVEVRQYFLRELKEKGMILCVWVPGTEMSSDLFTKNLPGPLFEKHTSVYCGIDEYQKVRRNG